MGQQLLNLQQNLETAVQRADAKGIEFWFARDLQAPLGYERWENFLQIQRATCRYCQPKQPIPINQQE